MMQPLVVKQNGNGFMLIAGERRFRAAKIAGLTEVPVIINDVNDDVRMLELALVENIQREDLNPLELAAAYRRLIEQCGLTQQDLSARVEQEPHRGHEYASLAHASRVDTGYGSSRRIDRRSRARDPRARHPRDEMIDDCAADYRWRLVGARDRRGDDAHEETPSRSEKKTPGDQRDRIISQAGAGDIGQDLSRSEAREN